MIGPMPLCAGCTGVPEGLEPVEGFETDRYLGIWYEIARFDHSFERGLEDVSATYSLRQDATIVEHRGDLLAMAPTSPYQKPLMGRLPEWRTGNIAAHFGGDGVWMSPATSEVMAELIETGKAPPCARRMLERLAPAAENG